MQCYNYAKSFEQMKKDNVGLFFMEMLVVERLILLVQLQMN